ncbi:MAG: TonB-dependent receptor [Tannerellaceae bacterium]|jgi:TonB-linked SusC/RagA family outer membrane protein|nr:TonB-dependent receptor [Tannerellaceae bacterium]
MRKSILCILAFLLLVCNAAAQNIAVSGTVTDASGEPLIGVNVLVKGTVNGVITDVDGKFALQQVPANATLVFSYVGYLSQEVAVGSRTTVNITLRDDTQTLEEVVVVGYGTQRKVTVTGAVASVSGEELKASPTTNLSNAMVGRMPGVIGFQRSDEPGGGGTTIRIRGTNTLGSKDPLVVIDGVADRGGGLNRINPNEIESMSVLKDAAAAIYGARAANGVILITTKRGKDGAPVVTFDGSYGFSQPTRLPEMANSFEYATMMNEIAAGTYSDEELQKFRDGSDPWGYPDSDWFGAVIKPVSPMYRADVGISGGSDKMKYYVNFAANGEDGVYKRSANRYDQYSVRLNLDWKLGKYAALTFGNTTRLEYKQYPAKDAGSIFSALRRGKPTQNAIWPTGEPGPDIEYGDNPVMTASDGAGFDQQKTYHVQNNVGLNVDIPWVEGLKLTANASYDKRFYSRKLFQKPVILYSWDGVTRSREGLSPGKRWISDPRLTRETEDQTDWMTNAILSYDKTFGLHTVGITAGVEAQNKDMDRLDAYRRYYLSDASTEINMGSMRDANNAGYSWRETRLNYFGRMSYNYMEKYLLEFVWRYDGSYRFPADKRYGFFPGIMAAWRASEEGFWKDNISVIDYFKLRASVSQTGNDALVDADGNVDRSIQYLTTYGKDGNGYIINGIEEPRFYLSRSPNVNITWEVGTTYNAGLDFKFFNNRLTWESDIFYHRRTHMLISRNASIPEILGITLPRENLGKMENKGFESLIGWSDKAGDFTYNVSLNMTYARNKILFWDETPGVPEYQQSTGHRANTNLYYVDEGIYHNQAEIDNSPHWSGAVPGDVRYKDVNGDGKINADDRVRSTKNAEPPFVSGLNIQLNWKNWDLMVLFQGAAGAEAFIRTWSGTVGNFLKSYYDARWTPENPNATGPRTYERENQYWANPSNASTFFLTPADYIRLKNMEIGYNIPPGLLKKAGISRLRIFANSQNVFIIDKIKVADPEVDNRDLNNYPQRRYFQGGISITF